MKRNWYKILGAGLLFLSAVSAKAQSDWNYIDPSDIVSRDSVNRNGYSLVFINKDAAFDKGLKQRLIDCYFTVYPQEVKTYNKRSPKQVTFVVDPHFDGIAATLGNIVRYNPAWFQRFPGDVDVVTHEVMHIVQGYPGNTGPSWVTEGIADYARFKYGVDNNGAGWSLPGLQDGQSYTDSYRITARFMAWVEKTYRKDIVQKLDASMRDASYNDGLWKNLTGKTVDELWGEYAGGYKQQPAATAASSLYDLQQKFVDLRFGMFIHFNIPTFMDQDWADPDASPAIFNPAKLDCNQWAKAAKAANMSYGCITTKHHSGFCIWDTKTTSYNVMNSPLKRDVVKEYVEAFRAQGLKTFLYYSILDTHHKIRPGQITKQDIDMIKAQLTELLTNYGEINALIIDGWDAPWSRISYDDVPFEELYRLIKSIQPGCLVMDLNSAKYPGEALMYTDIKSYEQGAGQHIAKEQNKLPALSCLPINGAWFWKTNFPSEPVKSASVLVKDNIIPLNNAHCNFILNVAPNRDGLIDDNALNTLAEIGKMWKNEGPVAKIPVAEAPIISPNIAKKQPANASWSDDMWIMDFGNDDNFGTAWLSNPTVKNPWYEVDLTREKAFNTIMIADNDSHIQRYRLEYFQGGQWHPILQGNNKSRIKIHRFDRVWGSKVRILIDGFDDTPGISEFGVYDERR